MEINTRFYNGDILRDKVSGFKGVVLGVTAYATGCVQYGLCPKGLDDKGNVKEWSWFDGSRLEYVYKNGVRQVVDVSPSLVDSNGGPSQAAPEM